ncbi:hypothetical protein VXN68_04055 [Acinetobacter schindleri]|uniref:hypothetical protein n=1 Tax=Acinetobacter schindleri TaxID=108981 RepID=UPI003A844DF5
MKPYTQAELDQQAIWANEFDQWWENEGQYQRAGGGQYERSFAWWAWLNREQNQQAIIDNLKAQLNNMEVCYIEKKKEVEELQGKSRCIKSLVEQRNLAENMLRKISVAAQKKLPTFGAALRFNDEVKEILRGDND